MKGSTLEDPNTQLQKAAAQLCRRQNLKQEIPHYRYRYMYLDGSSLHIRSCFQTLPCHNLCIYHFLFLATFARVLKTTGSASSPQFTSTFVTIKYRKISNYVVFFGMSSCCILQGLPARSGNWIKVSF